MIHQTIRNFYNPIFLRYFILQHSCCIDSLRNSLVLLNFADEKIDLVNVSNWMVVEKLLTFSTLQLLLLGFGKLMSSTPGLLVTSCRNILVLGFEWSLGTAFHGSESISMKSPPEAVFSPWNRTTRPDTLLLYWLKAASVEFDSPSIVVFEYGNSKERRSYNFKMKRNMGLHPWVRINIDEESTCGCLQSLQQDH
jgi:hypothetical protein